MSNPDLQTDATVLPRPQLVKLAKRLDVPAVGTTPDLLDAVQAAQKAKQDVVDAEVAAGADEASTSTPEPASAVAGERLQIAKSNDRAWWCPVCDHSMPHGFPHCAKCRSERDDDEVIVHAAQ